MTAASPPGLTLLRGVRVVDFTQALSGPYSTLMLADLGADVIKVERPGRGDDSRHWGPPYVGEDAAYFMAVNRNKRSVTLNLKSPSDLATARHVVKGADVLVENWRPGTAGRLGLDADTLRGDHPRLIYCSISGYGQDQPPLAAYDQIVQGTSGVMSLTGPVAHPTKWGVPAGDIAAGMFAAAGILAALYERVETGRGRTIDIAMQDSLLSMLTHHAARYLSTGTVPESDENMHPTIAPYGTFRTADGYVNICVGNDAQFRRLCEALQRPRLALDPRFESNADRMAHRDTLAVEISQAIETLTIASLLDDLARAGVPAGPVHDIGQALDDRAVDERQMILAFTDQLTRESRGVVNTPWKFDGTAPTMRLSPPALGFHNHEVLRPDSSSLPAQAHPS